MRSFDQIHATYLTTDDFLSDSENKARSIRSKAHWSTLRFYNDQAYYVMFFAQFEQFVDAECLKLIDRKKKSNVWKNRRLWDSTAIDRMQFMRKVALLTEKGSAVYNKIDVYYGLRCDIAHGILPVYGTMTMPTAIQDFRQFAKDLGG